MEEQFIPYKEALALKELGFDEPVFGYHLCKNSAFELELKLTTNWLYSISYDSCSCKAPLWQQAFDWFRDKKNFHCSIDYNEYHECYNGILYDLRSNDCISDTIGYDSKTYKEAALACLKKLIEIVKE